MRHTNRFPLWIFCIGTALAALTWHWRVHSITSSSGVYDRVVIAAPMQVLLVGGDRYLAANIESIRSVATSNDATEAVDSNFSFAIRTRLEVARLNPCHEDNYYFSNALLTWGGAVQQGNDILLRASKCRNWDELPPFFYGFNLFHFLHDIPNAKIWLEKAAERSPGNSAALRKLSIMIAAGEIKDDHVALNYLKTERNKSSDPRLQQMLDRRIGRLEGLIHLRQAQEVYEARFHRPLADPSLLITSGILDAFPLDPMRIGYEFRDGRFHAKEIKIAGAERPQ